MHDRDMDHWQQWLDRHGPALLLFARQWSATRADAEDAVQDGFVRFWRTRDAARDLLPYLYTCVRSAAMDLGRGQRRRVRREQTADRREASAFEFPAEQREREVAIEAALSQLPGDQRELVVMKIWGGLTFAEIGEALGVSLSTAASRYRYALARLEQELSAEVSP